MIFGSLQFQHSRDERATIFFEMYSSVLLSSKADDIIEIIRYQHLTR